MSKSPIDPKERFWSKVKIILGDNCWEWQASKFSNGYGQFFDGVNKIGAHKYSYIINKGLFDFKLKVCHTCDNKLCVNPDHLFLGTQKDNIQDMIKKNRKVNADTRGTKNGRAILNDTKVLEIRELYKNKTSIAQIARDYNVGESTIRHIVQMNTWRKIK